MALFLFTLLRGCSFLFAQKETKNAPGAGSEERQRSSRLPPAPRYGGRIPGNCTATPARLVQLIVFLSAPLPLAGQSKEGPASWTMKTRLAHAAVGAGSG